MGCQRRYEVRVTDEEIRAEALAIRDAHDPAQQVDNGYERCAHCHYTRHPCDAYDMADTVLQLLDRISDPNATCYACGKGPLVVAQILHKCSSCRAIQIPKQGT